MIDNLLYHIAIYIYIYIYINNKICMVVDNHNSKFYHILLGSAYIIHRSCA